MRTMLALLVFLLLTVTVQAQYPPQVQHDIETLRKRQAAHFRLELLRLKQSQSAAQQRAYQQWLRQQAQPLLQQDAARYQFLLWRYRIYGY